MRIVAFALLLFSVAATAQDAATFRVTFDATWSAQTHPQDFPGNPHFSPLVGAVHNADATLWEASGLSSTGMEEMAESGRTTPLIAEVDALITAGSVLQSVRGGGIGNSPGVVSLDVEVTADHPLVTLVSMLAPSPDWFVGTESQDLREGSGWAQTVTVPMYVWDAGTDSGPSYTSPNDDTDPAEPIARIEMAPFVVGGVLTPVGTMTFERLTASADEDGPEGELRLRITPNPARSSALISATGIAPCGEISVFDTRGRLVRTVRLAGIASEATVDVSDLAPGVYMVRLTSREATVTRSLVVAR